MRLENIRFAFDQAVLSASAYPELNRLVRFLKENPRLDVLIVGYTDNAGSPAYNLKLSQARAKVVYDYLVSKGIDRARLKYKGLGNQHPVASNATARGRAVNRRTEIIIR
ncbi:OmpA family protein [Candidatus Sulfidibacterium hydrothermale]|nr:OmpA family protein [Candidatus Sulfidibacterium hydrothermale]UBM63608.1 OmpA family protein [Candidatus Sulfidibacterium hydrothermale]